jgi:hypothetical protein
MLTIKLDQTEDGIFIITLEGTFENEDIPVYLDFSHDTFDEEQHIRRVSVIKGLRITGTKVREQMAQESKRLQLQIERTCVVGLTGLKRAFAVLFSRITGETLKNFDTLEEALAWLRS